MKALRNGDDRKSALPGADGRGNARRFMWEEDVDKVHFIPYITMYSIAYSIPISHLFYSHFILILFSFHSHFILISYLFHTYFIPISYLFHTYFIPIP